MQLDFPAPFVMDVTPRACDIDGLEHTNNTVYIQWCEQVAWAHSAALGLDIDDYRRLDRAMAIRRSEYDYLLPTHMGDRIVVATWIFGDGKITMERRFQMIRCRDNATVLRGRWELTCIELSSGRVRRMPPEFVAVYVQPQNPLAAVAG